MTDATLRALLAKYPDALVAAVLEDGRFCPMPDGVPVEPHRVPAARSALDLVHPDDRPAVILAWRRAKDEGAGQVPVRISGTDDQRAVLHLADAHTAYGVYLAVLLPVDGAPLSAGGAPVFVSSPPRLVRTRKNESAVLVDVDPEVTAVLGWTPAELLGRRSVSLLHPDDHAIATDAWLEVMGKPGCTNRLRVRHEHRDGRWVWVELSNRNLLGTPGAGYVECEMLDISDEMDALAALRASEQLLRRLAGALPVGVFHIDRQRQLLYVNDELHRICGSSTDTAAEDLLAAAADPEAVELAIMAVLTGVDGHLELGIDPLDGGPRRHCTLALRALTAPEGEVTGAVCCLTDVTDAVRMQAELERRATTDELTGCSNRSTTVRALDAALAAPHPGTAVVFVDLDGFKAVNDEHGHALGDSLLAAVAGRLRGVARGADVVGRLGGDEFLVVCSQVAEIGQAMVLADRIADVLRAPFHIDGVTVEISASLGVARTGELEDAESLIARADGAMYAAKRAGGRQAMPAWITEAAWR